MALAFVTHAHCNVPGEMSYNIANPYKILIIIIIVVVVAI